MASNGALYGIIGALGVAVVGGGLYIAKQEGAFGPPDKAAAVTAPVPPPAPVPLPAPAAPAPRPPVAAAPPPAPAPPPAAGPSQAEVVMVQQLVVDARRAITRGDFSAAGRALDQAERLAPRASDVIAARRDLRDAQLRANRDDRHRIDALVTEARAAIGRHDYGAANHLVEQAEQIDPRDTGVRQARAELAGAQRQQGDADNRRVDMLVAEARSAIARHDYAAADRLLDQAENIDRRDRDVQQARAELTAAQRHR
jgi:hypothetical protein